MIKTIWAENEDEFDDKVNAFENDKRFSVFATQTHVNQLQVMDGYRMQYTAVIFYKVRP